MQTILVCDDDKQIVEAIDIYLTGEGFQVVKAYDGYEALELLESHSVDLMIVDVMMPGLDGIRTTLKVRETSSIPIIILSAKSEDNDKILGLNIGADDYIAKPFHPMIVKARVNTHIKLYQYRLQIQRQALVDELTGVANRRQYDNYSAVKWQEAVRLGKPISICMFDIDLFKLYNDTYGHPAGDKVIAAVAGAVDSRLQRVTDFFARYGGEEFVALILGDDSRQAFDHMKRIRQQIEELRMPHRATKTGWVTVSIGGVTISPKSGDDYNSYLMMADAMLYDAKRYGRNMVVWSNGKNEQWREK